jgi:hypothetical protein
LKTLILTDVRFTISVGQMTHNRLGIDRVFPVVPLLNLYDLVGRFYRKTTESAEDFAKNPIWDHKNGYCQGFFVINYPLNFSQYQSNDLLFKHLNLECFSNDCFSQISFLSILDECHDN